MVCQCEASDELRVKATKTAATFTSELYLIQLDNFLFGFFFKFQQVSSTFISATFYLYFFPLVFVCQSVTRVSVDGCHSPASDSSTSCLLQVLPPARCCSLSACLSVCMFVCVQVTCDDKPPVILSLAPSSCCCLCVCVQVCNCRVLCLCRERTEPLCLPQVRQHRYEPGL